MYPHESTGLSPRRRSPGEEAVGSALLKIAVCDVTVSLKHLFVSCTAPASVNPNLI